MNHWTLLDSPVKVILCSVYLSTRVSVSSSQVLSQHPWHSLENFSLTQGLGRIKKRFNMIHLHSDLLDHLKHSKTLCEKWWVLIWIFSSYLTSTVWKEVQSWVLVLHSLNAGISLLDGPRCGLMISVWLLLPHVKTLAVFAEKWLGSVSVLACESS